MNDIHRLAIDPKGRLNAEEPSNSMDYLEKILEKLREWAQQLVDTLFGPQPESEPESIPIPVEPNPRYR